MQPPPIIGRPGPVSAPERIAALDIIRGAALFGILVVNMSFFGWPVYLVMSDLLVWDEPVDHVTGWFITFFFEGKFYTMFSFLFGLGFAIQLQRIEARGGRFVPIFARRLAVLFAIGTAHAYLIWSGDILAVYAVVGFALLLFRNCRPKVLIFWAAVCLSIPVLLYALFWGGMLAYGLFFGAEGARTLILAAEQSYQAMAEEALADYRHGSFFEILAQRARERQFLYYAALHMLPAILAMFLFGLWAGRRGVFGDIPANLRLARRMLAWGLAVGIPANAVYVAAFEIVGAVELTFVGLAGFTAFVIGAPALCFAYVSGIVLLTQREFWRKRLALLAPVGRMALTNYLLQSVVCTTIFYSYGLGLYGTVGPAAGLFMAVAIYLCLIPLSGWWLRRFRFGPMEWLWRRATYGKGQPL